MFCAALVVVVLLGAGGAGASDAGVVPHVKDEVGMINTLLEAGATPARATAYTALPKGQWKTLFEADGPGMVTHMWVTFPEGAQLRGRQTLLRMYWDNEKEPSVEAPLTDFFGVPHGMTGKDVQFSSHYISVLPKNGLNCYFAMPFAAHAKIEVLSEAESGAEFYFQVDYARFHKGLPSEYAKLRFHAQFRFENPCEAYGRNYLVLDAVGKGSLVGVTLGVQIHQPEIDWWVHGGGDMVLLDAETNPSVLHGIGLEDYFGQAWGVSKHQTPYVGSQVLGGGKIGVYRFYVRDPVVFHSSIRMTIGSLAHAYSSVAYWYQEEPHRPFFRTPEADKRMPDSKALYGTYDIEPEDVVEWKLLAPFAIDVAHPFDKERSFELKESGKEQFTYVANGQPSLPDGNTINVVWKAQKAYNGFLDFNVIARPAVLGVRPQTSVVGYALRTVECEQAKDVCVRIGFDDEVVVRINDAVAFEGNHPNGFRGQVFTAHLKKGSNRIVVKLSNDDNDNWKSWAFSFRIDE